MWILSSDGDFLQGKRIWLKPGKKYLFGRVQQDGITHTIDNRTISRKHLIIEVGKVKPGDGSHIHTKSKLIISDPGSRWGTTLDGTLITGESKELGSRDEYKLSLGRYPSVLRVKWCPIVLSFSFPTKQLKAKDPLAHARSQLEELDIKTVIPYVFGKTTHVVQSKRNTAKGLQALINGRYLVQDSFIERIRYAASPKDVEREESLSPLEEDFDSAWPDPTEDLPPRGTERIELPDSAYAPNPDRINVFEGYTFVFCDKKRFEDLQGPISNGHGKALLYDVEPGTTKAEDVVNFLNKAAGVKGLACEQDGTGGVMFMQFSKKGHEDWSLALENKVAQLTGQQAVEASDFLDAILRNNASQLYRRCEKPSDQQSTPPATVPNTDPDQSQVVSSGPSSNVLVEDSQKDARTLKRNKSKAYVPKFKDFDDGFDMDSIPVYQLEEGEGERDAPDVVPDSLHERAPSNVTSEGEGDDTVMDLLPGTAAMKQRGIKRPLETKQAAPPPQRVKKPKLDLKEAARQRREEVDEAATARRQEDAISFQAIVEGMDLVQIQKLISVEEMEVKPRQSHRNTPTDESRWDERWNGRQNFKKFRRKGNPDAVHRRRAIIVPLEEAKKKDFGIGDDYWAASSTPPERQRSPSLSNNVESTATSQEVPQPAAPVARSKPQKRSRDDEESDDGLRFRFRRKRQR
ncbi:DNA damage response protein RcaA [Nannizzia gypsea CBS 118893]|uniref:DNA damage response protein RcaA n=1 Tax=Arthroderma gypseum (strain ATCC MYA-4604 / CBS 118893) TaxID=535722 RepID=E4V3F3_ARTGP|nr:DNA damage response protein RcaA [Nannizzia gypsea CBS 118893]EFR04527.1 DNA damage response protein RcaA [Nannizzia gypsea CBS 118893]